jgi:hypothetical protein
MKRALLLCLAGCFRYSTMPNDRPDPQLRKLADAKILDMQINLHKQPGLCPGAEGKLYVNATVQWPNMKPVARSLGNDIDSLNPADFAIGGPLVEGDPRAHLHPDPDVLKSIESGFVVDVAYRPQPRFQFHQMFPPEYSCYQGSSIAGRDGNSGQGGNGGASGDTGQDGGPAGNGGPGEPGENGGRLRVYVTVVSTKFYPKLYAVLANGTFFLAPPDRQLVFSAPGGAGGPGGGGGEGGAGGNQNTDARERPDGNGGKTTVMVGSGRAGNGGAGGIGGDGGPGGNGGTVEVIYDAAYPELRGYIAMNVDGGPGGDPGAAGAGGQGGGTNADENAQSGQPGPDGSAGRAGRAGRAGHASIRAGNVSSMFRSIRGLGPAGGSR